jgi:serine/threonine-protein kinase PpkA
VFSGIACPGEKSRLVLREIGIMKKFWLALAIAALPLMAMAIEPGEGVDKPLLIPGKHSLYQRVLAVPGARLSTRPGSTGNDPVTPFTAFYVYARRTQDDTDWLQIGTDVHGNRAGWLPASSTIEWNSGLTAVFRDPADHDRVLLFKDSDSLRKLIQQHDLKAYDTLYQEAAQGQLPAGSPVVAIQPAGYIDIRDDFYLVPIQRYEDVYVDAQQARLLKVSSVPLNSESSAPVKQVTTATAVNNPQDYKAGLVFVIDSTLSMEPYIKRTREAVKKIYDTLGGAGLLGHVNFGLIAFRDNLAASHQPTKDYLVRTYVDLQQGRDAAGFLSRVNSLQAAMFSNRDFIEDSYAGIKEAIEAMNWKGYAARYIVLVTDAGPRDANDPLSSTGLGSESLRRLAQDKGIAIFVLHLLTPATQADHDADAGAYRKLADFPGIGSLYYGVPTGDVAEFGTVVDALAAQIAEQVRLAGGGKAAPATTPAAATATGGDAQLAELQSKVAKLGYALRMRYLQKTAGGKVPDVFDAWLLDRDFRDPERSTLDVRVLLTRDQLSDLHDVLKQVLSRAEEGLLSPQNFLNELKSLAATLSRTPEQLGATTATTAGEGNSLADMGFMREYIEDLPYTGEVMGLSLEDWQSWPPRQQVAFLNRLEEKVNYYRALHDHTDLWVSLDGGPVGGDSVFPVPLEMLP